MGCWLSCSGGRLRAAAHSRSRIPPSPRSRLRRTAQVPDPSCPPLQAAIMVQWKKTVFKSALISFVLVVVTITVLQLGTSPSEEMKSRFGDDAVEARKRNALPPQNKFWESQTEVADTLTPAVTEQQVQAWDVTTINCTANSNLTTLDWFKALEPNFQQFVLYRHCRYFPILINHPEKCSGKIDMLIVVKSIITQHDRREAIRKTWGKNEVINGKSVRTLFLLGKASKQEEQANYQKLLYYENLIYGDILQWDFLDTFFNLTLKEVHFLKWLSIYCQDVRHIFKGDDDVFVSPNNLLDYLEDSLVPNLFVGDVLYKARPIRKKDNKYYIPQTLYSDNIYPPYAGGGGFLMDGPLARRLYKASETLELYPIDDVFLGMCLKILNVNPIFHDGFKTFGIVRNKNSKMNKDPCFFRAMLVVHKLLPEELLQMWDLVHSNLTCSRKIAIQ
ncbi:UDP-GlcNAc:betaGal beta-1,3-N-acetylglucosaminyltransferase 7 [Ambystoma mexicanum]|uniref:UDP-GlcNAc:betaGal beta-1,3-N-acetylglucosaminyltransferase 7 n=1 Tax=Ambystoma mexicanum TaxID=8296 RepID=UPI0037E85FA9